MTRLLSLLLSLALVAGLALACPAPSSLAPRPSPLIPRSQADDWSAQLLAGMTTARAARHLAPFRSDPRLTQAAQQHSAWMLAHRNLNHYEGRLAPWDRMSAAGYRWSRAAENIAAGQTSAAQVLADWMQSPGHRANILGAYRDVGLGRAGNYWTEDFASP